MTNKKFKLIQKAPPKGFLPTSDVVSTMSNSLKITANASSVVKDSLSKTKSAKHN